MSSETDPELIKGLQAEYTPAKWTGRDESGIIAIGPHVVVMCDECAEIIGSIHVPIGYVDRMNLASEQGVIAQVAQGAFRIYEDGHAWTDYRPAPGDRVYFEKYAGRQVRGKDNKVYRLMDYRCIGAVYEKGDVAPRAAVPERQPLRETA